MDVLPAGKLRQRLGAHCLDPVKHVPKPRSTRVQTPYSGSTLVSFLGFHVYCVKLLPIGRKFIFPDGGLVLNN